MNIKISTPEKNSDTVRIFELAGLPSVIPNDSKPRIVGQQQIASSNSPAARHIMRQFGANNPLKSIAKEVRLNSYIASGGVKTDVVGVILSDGYKWDKNKEQEIVDILKRRLSHGCGIALNSSLRRDFAKASLDEVRGVLRANAPIEVSMHNQEREAQAVTIPDNGLDKENNIVTVFMGEACVGSGSACSSLALMSTQNRISATMATYYGVQTKFEIT